MNTMTTMMAVVLAAIAIVSAMGKLKKMPQVVESMTHVGVKPNQMLLLHIYALKISSKTSDQRCF